MRSSCCASTFARSLRDLINAARLDGANTLDILVHVVLPASRPILVTLALITVVSQWNNFMWPLVITSGRKWRVLTVATAGLQSQYNAQWTLVMAATTVAMRAADRDVRGVPAPHRPLDRGDGAQMTPPRAPRHVSTAPESSWLARRWRRSSTLFVACSPCCAAVLLGIAVAMGRTSEPAGRTVVTVRLWDQQVAAAYRESFAEFSRTHPDVEVRVNVVVLRHLLRHAAHRRRRRQRRRHLLDQRTPTSPPYADSGRLMAIDRIRRSWERLGGRSVHPQRDAVGRYRNSPTRASRVYYNADLLDPGGRATRELLTSALVADETEDTLRASAARLTVDSDGRRAGTPGFDADRIRQWGYNAANDLQGIYLNYIGSAGGRFPVRRSRSRSTTRRRPRRSTTWCG